MTRKSKRKKAHGFTITEKNGDKPIEEWLIPALKEFAKQKYSLNITSGSKKED